MSIPKNIFLAWDNPNNIPKYALKSYEEIKTIMPDWNVRFYTSFEEMKSNSFFRSVLKKLPFNLNNTKEFSLNFLKTLQADLFRIYLFKRYGGIWVDCDARVSKRFDENITEHDCFLAETNYANAGERLKRSNLDIFFMGMHSDCECLELVMYYIEKDIKEEKLNLFYPMSFSNVLERRGILDLNSRKFSKNYYFDKLPIEYSNEANNEEEKRNFYFCNFEKFPRNCKFYLKHYRITGGYGNAENL